MTSPASGAGGAPAARRRAPSGWLRLVLRGRRCQFVHAVLTGVCDQQGRGAVDVFGQHRDGPVRVAGEGEFLKLPVFGGQVALVIVGEDPVPPAVELGAVPERGGDRLEPPVAAAGQQGLVEVAVLNGPVLADRSVVPGDGRPVKAMVRGQDLGLPLQVTALDRQAQGERFDLDAGLGQLGDVLDRQATSRPCSVRRVSASRMTDWLTPNRSVSSTIFSFWPGWRKPLSRSDRSTSYTCSVRVAGAVTPLA